MLKSQEINLDYILELIFEHNKKNKDKATLIEEIRRVIRASIGNRAKESLVVDFINETDLETIQDKANVIDSFFKYAQEKQKKEASELITEENLNEEEAKRYIANSLRREFATDTGTELNALLPKMSPLNPQYLTKKKSVYQKIAEKPSIVLSERLIDFFFAKSFNFNIIILSIKKSYTSDLNFFSFIIIFSIIALFL